MAILPSHHGHDVEHWPLGDTLNLVSLPDAVPSARAHLQQLLSDWDRAELTADASVVISELVTNAVAASAKLRITAAPVQVWLGSDRHYLLLAVADARPRSPARLDLRTDAEEGRGLALVEALSSRWGWHLASMPRLRKVVWAEWLLRSGETMSAEETIKQGSPVPGPGRGHDVNGLTDAGLERTRRDLQVSLALARPGSAACMLILAHLREINTELAGRPACRGANGKPSSPDTLTTSDAFIRASRPGRPR